MKLRHRITSIIVLFTLPITALYPQNAQLFQKDPQEIETFQENLAEKIHHRFTNLIDKMQSNDFEEACTGEDLQYANYLFEFITRHNKELSTLFDHSELETEAKELFDEISDRDFHLAHDSENANRYKIIPALLYNHGEYHIIKCDFWKKVKEFCKNHKKAIIIGVVVTAVVVTLVVVVASATAAGAVAGAAASAAKIPPRQQQDYQNVVEKTAISLAKDFETQKVDTSFEINGIAFPTRENKNIMNYLIAHESCNIAANRIGLPQIETQKIHDVIDQKFSYGSYLTHQSKSTTIIDTFYRMRGEKAYELGLFQHAIYNFDHVINHSPTYADPYLQRSLSHFKIGDYEKALNDFQNYKKRAPISSQEILQCSASFAKGFMSGIYQSGKGLAQFVHNFLQNPVYTTTQIINAFTTLTRLATQGDYNALSEVLAPEVCELVHNWNNLSLHQKGNEMGYVMGKHGSDIFLPGALAKLASKNAKMANELSHISKNIKTAQETLAVEAASEVGSAAKVQELMNSSKLKLSEKLKEVSQTSRPVFTDPKMKASFEKFQQLRKDLKPYQGKYMTEKEAKMILHKHGVPTFPRPKGIPKDYKIKLSKKPGGIKYVHPHNEQISIRVMPGKPHSPLSHQQKPYVIQMKDGKAFDKNGNLVPHELPDTHIPINEFIYRE